MSFAHSDPLFPAADLAAAIADEYERQYRVLCDGQFPSWSEVQARFDELRKLL